LAEAHDALVCDAVGKRLAKLDDEGTYDAGLHTMVSQPQPERAACFDRAAYPMCYQKKWRAKEPYTVLVMNGPTEECGVPMASGFQAYDFESIPEQSTWLIYHAARGEEKGSSVYTHFADAARMTASWATRQMWQVVTREEQDDGDDPMTGLTMGLSALGTDVMTDLANDLMSANESTAVDKPTSDLGLSAGPAAIIDTPIDTPIEALPRTTTTLVATKAPAAVLPLLHGVSKGSLLLCGISVLAIGGYVLLHGVRRAKRGQYDEVV